MKRFLLGVMIAAGYMVCPAQTLHVSPTGSDNADGSISAPLGSIEKAMELVQPGGTIYLHEGTYYPEKRILVPEKNTDETHRISLMAYGTDKVYIDGSKMNPGNVNEFKGSRCMYFCYWANYWYVKGITFQNAFDNGVKVEGSYNIFENCVFRNNNDTGLQIGMFKDWSIEECKGFPIKGTPEFNPGYTYCRGNKIINCDSYNNYDAWQYGGKADDGGDADGFACKLFPGPGTEFYGCRAWNNSDDNWDLYMVYHPVVIDNCWAWNAALDADDKETPGNGNGFKLGGGGSAGGAAFDQSTGAHVVRNCVSFSNTKKGFDQNNAYEGMYLFNNVAWDNDFNYRFPTVFKYGGMHIRNCVGFAPRTLNHEFLSANKEGAIVPDTDFNSWTTIDGCDPYKDGNKVGKTKIFAADYTAQFKSLAIEQAKAPRKPDGSLPENDFARLIAGSVFIDKGQAADDFIPVRFMTEAQAAAVGLELSTAPVFTIEYNDAAPDMGAVETGVPTVGRLYVMAGQTEQLIYTGTEIEPVVIQWGGAATDVAVTGEGTLKLTKDMEKQSLTVSGSITENTTVSVTTIGGETAGNLTLTFKVSEIEPATLSCTSGNLNQTVFLGREIDPIIIEWGGGATGIDITGLPAGLTYRTVDKVTTISGTPTEDGAYTIQTIGGMKPMNMAGKITRVPAYKVLTGDWYNIQDEYTSLHAELKGIVSLEDGGSYVSTWNPAYTESGNSVPGGCTQGAVNVERDGALVWKLPSLLELKANIHFTGGRTLQVKWQYEGEDEHVWTSSKMSKTTLTGWDIMSNAGIPSQDKPVTVKFVNSSSYNNGGIRVYDFYVKVFGDSYQSSIETPENDIVAAPGFYVTASAIVFDTPVAGAALYRLDGRCVAKTTGSTILPRNDAASGIYILQTIDTDGTSHVSKISLR